MKQKIHPDYHKVKVNCACGNTFETGSVLPKIEIEICNACHPFYTGKEKVVDTAGRVERFNKRRKLAEEPKKEKVREKKEKETK